MFDQILKTLQNEATPQLKSKFGLNDDQANGSVIAAADSVKEVLGGADGFGLDDAMNLFSSSKNSAGADGILNSISGSLVSKLTGQVGLDSGKANGISALLVPMVTELITKQLGGNSQGLSSLLGKGGLADAAKGMLGGLFK